MSSKTNNTSEDLKKIFSDEKYIELFQNYINATNERDRLYREINPDDAPNDVLNHAKIDGIAFFADEVLAKGDFFPFLRIGSEQFFVWVYEEDTEAYLISEVNSEVKNYKVWKTGVSILEAALTLMVSLEGIFELDYNWIYRFNIHTPLDKLHYLKNQEFNYSSSSIRRITDIEEAIRLIELLHSDDNFFIASQNIIHAKKSHDFCQICALTPEHARKHKHYEPEIWEQINWIPKMEIALVQATRAVESLIGKPGKNEKRIRQRWVDKLNLDPDESFKLADKSYLEYYYDLFQIRGSAAHSLGKISFEITRTITIQAQSFAWIIINRYYEKKSLDKETALNKMCYNPSFINLFPENRSTNCTKK
ncbi:hypothetical protein [uncultured Christiangramia sp.]|uniref:hypothetical protein n=1 Tax=uncultured Christiangramia sp. TaxID=503836 RepID=UPI002630E4AA|nr:hypothetical protein [uncultured Christiangramia sp.]